MNANIFGSILPRKHRKGTRNANCVAHILERPIPCGGEGSHGPSVSDGMARDAETVANRADRQRVGDVMDGVFCHTPHIANSVSNGQANISLLCRMPWQSNHGCMKDQPRPHLDIAERIKWHRETVARLTQNDYALSIGVKRSALSLWEAGTHRLSLDGALALRTKYGLSLDFMYEGIDDALPMTLRNAWRDKP